MNLDAAATLAVVDPQAADPGDEGVDREGPRTSRHGRAQPDEGMTTRAALPVPGPATADRDLELDHRLEPVDVRALEQSDLDESHGPARIASAQRPSHAVTASVAFDRTVGRTVD